jgi:hypothetical protein
MCCVSIRRHLDASFSSARQAIPCASVWVLRIVGSRWLVPCIERTAGLSFTMRMNVAKCITVDALMSRYPSKRRDRCSQENQMERVAHGDVYSARECKGEEMRGIYDLHIKL